MAHKNEIKSRLTRVHSTARRATRARRRLTIWSSRNSIRIKQVEPEEGGLKAEAKDPYEDRATLPAPLKYQVSDFVDTDV